MTKKGEHLSEETKHKLSEAHLGKHHSEASIMKMSGINNHNYGKHLSPEAKEILRQAHSGKHPTEESRRRMSASGGGSRGRICSEKTREKMRQSRLGTHPSEETRRRIGEAGRGRPAWNKGLEGLKGHPHSEETRKKMSVVGKISHNKPEVRMKHSKTSLENWKRPEFREQMSNMMRAKWKDRDFVKKVMKSLGSKTRPEQYLDTLLQQLYPGEFVYNGDYSAGISLDGLIPDFVNVNGKKQVIEMNGVRFHQDTVKEEKRISRYAKCGFSCLIITDMELKNDRAGVVTKIIKFVGKPPAFIL